MTLNITTLWDYSQPELSEQRFLSLLETASDDDRLILQTQIARTYGIRRNFSRARENLAEIAPQIQSAGDEAKVRYFLELGRTYSSATHPQDSQTNEVKKYARDAYMQAFKLAQAAELDYLAIDAIHMMTFVDTSPEEQLNWNYQAIALMESSSQQDARKWEGSLHNNTGYALHNLGRYKAALREFELALAARQRSGDHEAIRIAYWMIAWTLRALDRLSEALEIQLRLEKECEEEGEPDPYVFEELELLYRALDDPGLAERYAARRKLAIDDKKS